MLKLLITGLILQTVTATALAQSRPSQTMIGKKTLEAWVLGFSHPGKSHVRIPPEAAREFFKKLDENAMKTIDSKKDGRKIGVTLDNLNYAAIIDYSAPSTERRFFFINLKTGGVKAYYVAHGKGSVANTKDRNQWRHTRYFSNTQDSKATSLGNFVSGGTYMGKHGLALKLFGIDEANSEAFDRAIVIHGASYVGEDPLKINGNQYMGMSWGCPALGRGAAQKIIPLLAGGSLIYAYHKEFTPVAKTNPLLLEPPRVLKQLLKNNTRLQGSLLKQKVTLNFELDEEIEEILMPGEDTENLAKNGQTPPVEAPPSQPETPISDEKD